MVSDQRARNRANADPSVLSLNDTTVTELLTGYLEILTKAKRSPDRERGKVAVLIRHPLSKTAVGSAQQYGYR